MAPEYTILPDIADRLHDLPADSILSQTLLDTEDLKVTLFGFAAGQELTEHAVGQPAVLYFLKGEATLKLGNDQHVAGPGSWIHLPASLPHSVRAETELVFVLHLIK